MSYTLISGETVEKQLSYKEFFLLSQILAKEQMLNDLQSSIITVRNNLEGERVGIFKVYDLPIDKPFRLDETRGVVILDNASN